MLIWSEVNLSSLNFSFFYPFYVAVAFLRSCFSKIEYWIFTFKYWIAKGSFPLKSLENNVFSDDFRGNRS